MPQASDQASTDLDIPSQPMPAGEGKTIAATGKRFKRTVATVGHWRGDVMDPE